MNEQEPISEFEIRQAREWRQRWNALKYLLLAFRRLIIWILGLGIGLSAFMDALQKLIGGAGIPK